MIDTVNAIFLQSDFDPMGGMKFIHLEDFLGLIIRLSVHMLFVLLLVRAIYYPIAKRKDFLFTYLLFSLTIFLMCFMLESVKLQMGFALGLFAVFGIIRYRTDAIPIKEMTYLFVVIGMSVMNALINKKISLVDCYVSVLPLLAWTSSTRFIHVNSKFTMVCTNLPFYGEYL